MFAAIGVPLSIMSLAIVGGNIPPDRALYAFPLAYAFMFFYLIKASKKKGRLLLPVLRLLPPLIRRK